MDHRTTTQRGYGWQHQQARERYIAAWGNRPCVRCDQPINTGQPIDLDHDDDDRSRYLGISHASCNRSAAGRKSQALRARDPEPISGINWQAPPWNVPAGLTARWRGAVEGVAG